MTRSSSLFAGLIWMVFAASSHAATITVDDDGPADYDNIQEAIDNASPGDTILVAPGFYPQEIVVHVSVSIIGSGIGQTVVVPESSRPGTGPGSQLGSTAWVFRVTTSDVTIASMSVLGDNPNLGGAIDARGGIVTDFNAGTFDRLLVSGVEVDGVAYRGIYAAAGGVGHSFISNTVRNINQEFLDSVGIFFFDGEGEARSNVVENCSVGIGFQNSGGGNFTSNQITGCDVGILSNSSSVPVSITSNTLDSCTQGVQTIAIDATATIDLNTTTQCGVGVTCFGLGAGINVVERNTLDGSNEALSAGLFVGTNVAPFGVGEVHVTANDNSIINNDYGIILDEDPGDSAPILDTVIGDDPARYNVFGGNAILNVRLQSCDDDIVARSNFWGVASNGRIEAAIHHQVDDPLLGLVDFSNPVNLVVTVDDDGGFDFTEINPAVQAVWPGGTVQVHPGLYVENVEIDRPLLLSGAGTTSDSKVSSIVISDGFSPTESVVAVASDDVIIENLRIDGIIPTGDFKIRRGIYGSGIDGLTIRNCVSFGSVNAIAYDNSTNGVFTDNEIFDFGRSLNEGGGIVCSGSTAEVGRLGEGNYCHDGFAGAIVMNLGASGTVVGNRVSDTILAYLCNGVGAQTTYTLNEAVDCSQGYQAIGNNNPVTYDSNTALGCSTGFILFPPGVLHTYTHNLADGHGSGNQGLYFSTASPLGDNNIDAVVTECVFTGFRYGVRLEESASSEGFSMNADLSGTNGSNLLYGNNDFDIFLDGCNDDIQAVENQFGTTDSAAIEGRVFHRNDDPALGLVAFSGFLSYGPEIRVHGGFEKDYRVTFIHVGLPNELAFIFFSLGTGCIDTNFGKLLLDPLFMRAFIQLPTGPAGVFAAEFTNTFDTVPGVTVYFQSFVTEPGTPPARLTIDVAEGTTR